MSRISAVVLLAALLGAVAPAQLRVVTSTTDLAEFVRTVGGDRVQVDFIVRGTQNPHFVEVKPSYMMKLKSAQAFVLVGMQMEPWASQIIDGSRNANLLVIDCSRGVAKMEVPPGKVDASQGDVHPFGNPHYWLDPENVRVVLGEIVEGLAKVSPGDLDFFRTNADAYVKDLESSMKEWRKLLDPFRGRTLVTYHTSFSYFAHRFGIEVVGYVEPKPGIPPTPSHITDLTKRMKARHVCVIGVEQFYEESIPRSLARSTGAAFVRLSTAVGGLEGTDNYKQLIGYNVRTLATAFRDHP